MSKPVLRPRATSVTHDVAATLRGLMARGELRPGMRLPSERALAARLSVSRVTVVRALATLRYEGLVHTRHGSGTFVATSDRLIDTIAARQDRSGPAVVAGADALDLRWATTAGPADLTGVVQAAVRDALPVALRGDGAISGSLGGLTELLAGYLTGSGLPTGPGQLTLTSGAMTGLGLVLDVAGPAGRLAVAETPTYPGALRILSQHGRRTRGWPASARPVRRLRRPGRLGPRPPGPPAPRRLTRRALRPARRPQPDRRHHAGRGPGRRRPRRRRGLAGRDRRDDAAAAPGRRPGPLAGRARPPGRRRLLAEQDRVGRAAAGLGPRPGRPHPPAARRRRRDRRGPQRARPDHRRPAAAHAGSGRPAAHPAARREPAAPRAPPARPGRRRGRDPLAPPGRRHHPVARPAPPLVLRGGAGMRPPGRAPRAGLQLRRRRPRRPAPADPVHAPARRARPGRQHPRRGSVMSHRNVTMGP